MDQYRENKGTHQGAKQITQCADKCAVSLPFIALAFLLGVCALQLQPELQSPAWIQSELLIFLPVFGFIFYFRPTQRILMALLLGYLWALMFAHSYLQHRLDNELEGEEFLIRGKIVDIVEQGEQSARFNFVIDEYVGAAYLNRQTLPRKLRLSWYHNKQIMGSGEHWQLLVKLKAPHGFINPNGFDYEKWLYQKGVHATGYVRKSASNQLMPDRPVGMTGQSIDGIRQHIQKVIARLPDQSYVGLLQALSIGHKSLISPAQWQVLVASGTSHLLAISGLHIGLVAGLVFFVARKCVPAGFLKSLSAQQYAALASIFIAAIYTALAGFSVPTQRAFIMLLVLMLAVLLKRPAFSLNTLSLALLAVLIHDPVSVLGVGFWLSFSAVLLISLIAVTRMQSRASWAQAVKIQWIIALAMLPLSVLLFQQASIISPIANMLMIPLVGLVVVPITLLASLLSLLSLDLSLWFFALASQVLGAGWQFLLWLVDSTMATWQQPVVPLLYAILALLGGVLLLFPGGIAMRYSGAILLLPMLLYEAEKPANGDFWVTVLDVGQGLSILLRTHEKALLYDAGSKMGERFDIGQQVVVPYLRAIGVQQLDMLMISHADNDHSGGAPSVIQQLQVKRLLVGGPESEYSLPRGSQAITCKAGDQWQWDGVLFEVLHPQIDYTKTNNQSCVLRVSNAQKSILLSGDIEKSAELNLLKYAAGRLASDVLLVPHHGSNTSSSIELLKVVSPSLAVVSAGYKNRFRHPTRKVVSRYASLGIEVLNTAHEGAIELQFSQNIEVDPVKVKRHRKERVHYWNHRF